MTKRETALLNEVRKKLSNRYKILSIIGSGGMGTVFKAIDVKNQNQVALKILHPELAIDQDTIKRFLREAKLVSKLNHPNIVRLLDSGSTAGYYYIAMEYIDGDSLDNLLKKKKRFSEEEFLSIAKQSAQALGAAHKNGIIHRDIKPSNIIVDKNNHVSLLDFGVGVAIEKTTLTRTGLIIGTPQYISPEQAMGNKATALSDIYSLGVVFYQCLTGNALFEADTPIVLLNKHIQEQIPKMSSADAEVSEKLELIINKMLSKEPALRYSSAEELIDDLEAYQKKEPLKADNYLFEAMTIADYNQPNTNQTGSVTVPIKVQTKSSKIKKLALITSSIFLVLAVASSAALLTSKSFKESSINRLSAIPVINNLIPKKAELMVYVRDSVQKKPLKNVLVKINKRNLKTNENGVFLLKNLELKKYSIEFSKNELEPKKINLTLKEGKNEFSIEMKPVSIRSIDISPFLPKNGKVAYKKVYVDMNNDGLEEIGLAYVEKGHQAFDGIIKVIGWLEGYKVLWKAHTPGKLVEKLKVKDVNKDKILELLVFWQLEDDGSALNIVTGKNNNFRQLGSFSGIGVGFEDLNKDGIEEVRILEINSPQAEESIKLDFYKWDGRYFVYWKSYLEHIYTGDRYPL